MNILIHSLYFRVKDLVGTEDGQDLVEYALVVALIAFGATVAMRSLATEINTVFNTISTDLVNALA
jgi:pilus assembly protein Flp/PilA